MSKVQRKLKKELRVRIARNEFYNAWNYLEKHTIFNNRFMDCLDIELAKVNPSTNCIESSGNTKVEVWLECGPWDSECRVHDIDLDCGGSTFEEAIITLAKLVKEKYN